MVKLNTSTMFLAISIEGLLIKNTEAEGAAQNHPGQFAYLYTENEL